MLNFAINEYGFNVPWSNKMPCRACHCNNNEYSSRGHICPSQERVLPTDPRNSGDHDGFCAMVLMYGEVCNIIYYVEGEVRLPNVLMNAVI